MGAIWSCSIADRVNTLEPLTPWILESSSTTKLEKNHLLCNVEWIKNKSQTLEDKVMDFKPEYVNFHREAYQAQLLSKRPKDYPLLNEKKVSERMNLSHRRPNPYVKDGKAMVSFVVSQNGIKADILKAVDLIGGFDKSLHSQDRILIKPNYNSDDPPPGSTALDFLGAVIDLLREHGYSKISIAEGCGRPWVPTQKVFDNIGLSAKTAEMDIPLMDLDTCEYADVTIGGDHLNEIRRQRLPHQHRIGQRRCRPGRGPDRSLPWRRELSGFGQRDAGGLRADPDQRRVSGSC